MDFEPSHIGDWVGGFTAAEGTFTETGAPSFTFAISLAASDLGVLEDIRALMGVGNLNTYERRQAHHQDVATYVVRSLRDLVDVIVPFMDEHLPPSHKRRQYLDWRSRLLDYWQRRAKRVRPCTVEGCEAPRRAHGYCRHHLYTFMRQ